MTEEQAPEIFPGVEDLVTEVSLTDGETAVLDFSGITDANGDPIQVTVTSDTPGFIE